ncbi:MAG: helix-turn-helix domain-containing protein [Dehalococcoidia bacterium]
MNMNERTSKAQAALAQRLRETREYLNLSQQFVAEQTGIPRSAISDIERGGRKVDSIELTTFARLYRFPVAYFLGEEEAVSEGGTIGALARAAGELTEKDREEVLRFATFLRHYSKPPQGG